MTDKVLEYIKKFNMIKKGDTVVAGISGGADSVCLLFVLLRLRDLWGIKIVAVHVNHGLRGKDADADEDFTVKLCRENDVKCAVYHKNVKEIAKTQKISTEEAGRNARRDAFEETLQAEGGAKIATAHHKNDNAETVLLNLARGTGLAGLAGIPPAEGNVIHPLLCLTKKEIESYVSTLGCGWRTDATNEEEGYTRNLIRKRIIPLLEENVNSAAAEHINAAAEKIRQAFEYMQSKADFAARECVSLLPDKSIRIDKRSFVSCDDAIKGMVALKALKLAAGEEKDIGAAHVEALTKLFLSQCGRVIDLPYNVTAKRDYEGAVLRKKTEGSLLAVKKRAVKLNIPGETFIPGENMRVSARVFEKSETHCMDNMPAAPYTKWFDYDIIGDGLCMRYRRPGDFIIIGASGGRQKLKSYFINEKIPEEKRGEIPLLADGGNILWVVKGRTGAAFRVTESTRRILEIKISEEKRDVGESRGFDTSGKGRGEN